VVIIVSLTSVQQSNLQLLKTGQLTSAYRTSQNLEPIIRLKIAEELTGFPREILDLADCLEILDLSNNRLSELPDDLDRLVNMRILFLTNNDFKSIPAILASCPKLEMISFKSNGLTHIDEDVLPVDTRWLILTDNQLARLPESMGKLHRLQKLALAGNCLTQLPESMAQCENLELARLSANQLGAMPDWLFQMPKLAWLAFSGNEFNRAEEDSGLVSSVLEVPLANIQLGDVLGEGASGLIYQGEWIEQPASLVRTDNTIAVKIFKGAVTSDGYPQDELDCCLTAGEHENLIKVVAQLDQSHQEREDAEKRLGLVMELIPKSFINLGLPPSFQTCTRDTFEEATEFDVNAIAKVALQMANTLAYLYKKGISHGDVYAHNTMINDKADMLFGDFGAATNLSTLPQHQRDGMERIEVRAFGNLLDDLLVHRVVSIGVSSNNRSDESVFRNLIELRDRCLLDDVSQRPSFTEIQALLSL
jgi:hypothetical protein